MQALSRALFRCSAAFRVIRFFAPATWRIAWRAWLVGGWVASSLMLSACDPLPRSMGVGITGYNFTGDGVQEYFVEGQRVSNLPPYGGGGKTSCCVLLPKQWTPALTVTVDWTIGHYTEPWEKRKYMPIDEEEACCWTQRTLSRSVPIERYGPDGGGVQVFFMPDDEVRVYVTDYGLGHEKHPSGLAYPKKPASFE